MFDLFSNINVDWMGIRKPLIAVSIFILLAGLVSAIGRQFTPGGTDAFNLGVDFQGGSVVTAKFKGERPSVDEIRDALQTVGLNESVIQDSTDKGDEVLIKIPLIEGEDGNKSVDSNINTSVIKETVEEEPKAESENQSDANSNVANANSNANANTEANNSEANANSETNANSNVNSESNTATNTNTEANTNNTLATNSNGEGNTNTETAAKTEDDELNQVDEGRKLVVEALNKFGKEAPAGVALEQAADAKYKIVGIDSVGPVAGEQLRNQAVIATLLGMFGILFFIAFRYDWTYAAGAVIAVFHDVLITLAFFTMFQWEVSLTVLAALLTLVGFSVNDSIVIFDRIRENITLNRNKPIYGLTNDSINQTMSRTIVTNGLVFLAVLALVLFGGEVLRGFSLALFVGSITGTYSTVAIASPIAIWWQSKLGESKMKDKSLEKDKNKLASAARGSVRRRPVSK
ncbi:MAG: protein translocase subunit SecF [Acidobacteriota bacterium]|jgi:preprotein translocase subunit SecF|nr:protein translocase subunit SecF [Acidobacteriota bacterium]